MISFSMSAARCLISSLTLQHSWLRCFFVAFSALDISRTFLAHTSVLHIPHSTLTQACYGSGHKGVSCAHDSYLCHSSQPPIPRATQRRRPTMKTPRARWPQIMTTRIAGGLLLGYNPWKAGARLKTPAFASFRPNSGLTHGAGRNRPAVTSCRTGPRIPSRSACPGRCRGIPAP